MLEIMIFGQRFERLSCGVFEYTLFIIMPWCHLLKWDLKKCSQCYKCQEFKGEKDKSDQKLEQNWFQPMRTQNFGYITNHRSWNFTDFILKLELSEGDGNLPSKLRFQITQICFDIELNSATDESIKL